MTQHTTRREILVGAGGLALAGALPAAIHAALAAEPKGNLAGILKGLKPVALNIPPVAFKIGQAACAGPWGEVRIARAGQRAYPVRVRSANGLGAIEMATLRPFVQLGAGRPDAVTWSAHGVIIGRTSKLEKWSTATARKLADAIKADRHKVRALMQLRSTLISSYPAYLDSSGASTAPELAAELQYAGKDIATSKETCSPQERERAVQRFFDDVEEVWLTAAEQYEQCLKHETSGAKELGCSYLPAGDPRNFCAATVCTAKGFVDLLVDTIESVRVVTEIVVEEVIVCTALSVRNAMIATWSLADQGFTGFGIAGKQVQATFAEKEAALRFVREGSAALGPMAQALVQAQWEIKQEQTRRLADGTEVQVHDVKARVRTDSLINLTAQQAAAEFAATQTMLIFLLAALSLPFAAAVASWGVVVPAALQAAAAPLSAGATVTAAMIVALILLVLTHGSLVLAQLESAKQSGQLADKEAQIEHSRLSVEQVFRELEYQRQGQSDIVADWFQPPVVIG